MDIIKRKKKLKTERFRYPRIIVEGEDMFHSYHENKAEAKEMLNILQKEYTDNILYAEDFICANNNFKKKPRKKALVNCKLVNNIRDRTVNLL